MSETYSTLTETLGHAFETGDLADVEFHIFNSDNNERVKVKAHSMILKTRTPVFIPMLSKQWRQEQSFSSTQNVSDDVIKIIEIRDVDPDVFRSFIWYLYTDELKGALNLEELFDLMALADMYGVRNLYEKISIILDGLLWQGNFVCIYESVKVLNPDLAKKTFDLIIRNISELLKYDACLDTGMGGDRWSLKTWIEILSTDVGLHVEEIDLFKALLKWAGDDESRKSSLKSDLIPLVRFPLMSSEEFTKNVVPSGLLKNIEVIKMLMFYLDYKGIHRKTDLQYPLESRSIKIPTTSHELQYFLKRSSPGDVINLMDREYEGTFIIPNSYIILKGTGPNSCLISRNKDAPILTINGNRCELNSFKVTFINDDKCSEHEARTVEPLIKIIGHRNSISMLTINTGTYWTNILRTAGTNYNPVVSDKLLRQNPCWGIQINGDENEATGVNFVNKGNGIFVVEGDQSKLSKISYNFSLDGKSRCDFATAILLGDGTNHQIEDIGDPDAESEEEAVNKNGWYFSIKDQVSNSTIRNCAFLGINVDGFSNDFENVKSRKWIKILGYRHNFENCITGQWVNHGEGVVIQHEEAPEN